MPRQPRQPREPRDPPPARQPRTTPTRKHNRIEDSMRERLINAVFMEGLTVNEVAKRYQFPVSSVRTIVTNFEQTGRIAQLPRGGNRHRAPEPVHIQWMTDQLELDPELSMEELHQRLTDHFKLSPPITKSAIQKVMAPLMAPGFRFVPVPSGDDVEDYNTPALIAVRQAVAKEFVEQHEQLTDCIFVAEAGYNLRMWRRRKIRSKGGNSASTSTAAASDADAASAGASAGADADDAGEGSSNQRGGSAGDGEEVGRENEDNDDDDGDEAEGSGSNRSTLPTAKNTSLVVAMDKTGVIASDLRLGATSKDEVLEQFLLQKLLPKLRRPRVIVMEKARFLTRGGAAVTDACRRNGGQKIAFLPSDCNPFLNAAAFCFASIQSHLRKSDVRRDTLNGHMHASFNAITREMAQDWVTIVENNLILALDGEKLTVSSHSQGSDRSGGESDDGEERNQQKTEAESHLGVMDIDTDY